MENENRPTTIVTCQFCGAQIGEYLQEGGRVLLRLGQVILDNAHGQCLCGTEWHWCASDQLLDRLVERAKRRI